MTTPRSWFVTVGFMAVLLCLSGGPAFADFDVHGSTSGAFYLGPLHIGPSIPKAGLSFSGTKFEATTNQKIVLGTFNLDTLLAVFNPFDFKLRVDFTAPPGAGSTTFSADLSGIVSFLGGSAKIDFVNNGPRHFTFSNGESSGSFDLSITDVRVANHSSSSIIGTISNATFATTPEPTSIILIGTLLGGIALFRKRLRRR
jgi:hypothetical protein